MSVSRLPAAAVVDTPVALISGYAAWLIHTLLRDMPGGLEAKLERLGATPERQQELLRAHAALGHVGARWRLSHATSTSGSEPASGQHVGLRSPRDVAHAPFLGSREVASMLDVTDRQVRLLAESGRLRGSRGPGGRWQFQPADVAAEQQRRAEEAA